MATLHQCAEAFEANVLELQTENERLNKLLLKMKQFACGAVREKVQVLELKATMDSQAMGKTLEDLSALAVPPTLDQVDLDGLLG